MSEFLELLLKILVILNPVGALLLWNRLSWPLPGTTRQAAGIVSGLLVFALLGAAALLGTPILDFLKISPSSFQIATGILLLLSAMRLFVRRDPFTGISYDKEQQGQGQEQVSPVVPVALLTFWVVTQATLAAALLYGVTRDRAVVLTALAVAAAITAILLIFSQQLEATFQRVPLREIGRALGMALIVLAVDFIVDGITNV